MTYLAPGPNRHDINLQATLSASSAITDIEVQPHHPITCTGRLWFHEDGSLECEHARTAPGDRRTAYCIDHSIALLLIEVAVAKLGGPVT
jgi:hypothetical protein